jgi:hypothetical protein
MANWKTATWQVAAIVAAVTGVAWASGWDEARSKAEDAKRKADEVQKASVQASHKVVGAMCQARDLDRLKDTGRSEASNVRSDVRSKLDAYHHAVSEAIDRLDHIDSKDSHHGDASSLERDLKDTREKVDRMTYKIADGSPEFLDDIVRAAESARSDHRGRCAQKGFSADGDRIDCMIKESDTCYVVETALDNASSQSSARDRARRGVDHVRSELKRSSPTREVNGCVRVEPRVDCLKVCPEVGSDGRVGSPRVSWHERCS